MRYKALKAPYALETLEALRRGALPEGEETRVVDPRGAGPDDVERYIEPLVEKLNHIRSRYPEHLRQRDPRGGQFEAEACVEIHKCLPFDPAMLGDHEFWTWLAVFRFRELVDWRYGGKAAPANFGIGNWSENLMYRLWLRADIVYKPGDKNDPYSLARRGDQDFWRSHVFRQDYGKCRSLVRALVRYQFPDSSPDSPTLNSKEIRELAKRLRRLHPTLIYECLDESAAYELVQREAEAVKRALKQTNR